MQWNYNPEKPVVTNLVQNLSDNGYLGWNDLFLPGSSAMIKMFDLNGKEAAQQQFENQKSLDEASFERSQQAVREDRAWQEYMSSTAIQRQVKDIEAAGLNPWLALSQLGGAATPSGASASSSSGSASMANNKLAAAAGVIAMALRIFLSKH